MNNNNFSSSESLQNVDLKNNTSKLNDNNVIDQNTYTKIENGGSMKFSQLSNSKIPDKEDGPRQTLYSDDKPGIESTSFQLRKSIPVQSVSTVQQSNSFNSLGLQKNGKFVNDAPVENIGNLNNSLVSSEKQDVILDPVPTSTTDKLIIKCSETEQKINESNAVDIHSHQSDIYDDENVYDSVASNEVETSNSHILSESSKDNCEGDYVGFNESYDSHQDCPSILSSHSQKAECLLNTQKSFEEENSECTTSMKIDPFPQNQKSILSKITHCESADVDCAEESALGCSFSDCEVEPEHVADNSEEKGNGTSLHNDDAFEVDSNKLTKSVDMSPIAPSNLPSSADDVKFNCKVLLYDTLAGRKRKNDLKEGEVYKDVKKRILVSNETKTVRNCKNKTLKKATKEALPSQKTKTVRNGKNKTFNKATKEALPSQKTKTVRNGKNKTFNKATKEALPSQKPNGLSSYEKMIEEKRAERIAFMKSMEIYKIKEEISEARTCIKQLKKNSLKKKDSLPSNEPIRRSKRLPIVEVNFSEKALQELAVKDAFQVLPDPIPFEVTFEDVLKTKRPYEECVNDLLIKKPKCTQEYISYEKAVLENMTLKKIHVREVVRERITSVAWYPSKEDLIVAAADKFGNLSLWNIQDSETTPYLFSIHDFSITNMQFNSFDPVQLITSSFDGTMLCGDLIKHTFNEIYNSDSHKVTWFDFLSRRTFLASHSNGEIAVFDMNTNRKTSELRHACHDSMINTVSVHPVNKNIFVTCDCKKSIRLWDLRKLQKDPIVEILHHRNTVISAHFSPVAGNSILSTALDNSICIFDSTKLMQGIKPTKPTRRMNHSIRNTGFKATWLPHSDDLFAVGCFEDKQKQRKIQIYDKDLNLYHNMMSDKLKTVTLVQCFHPYKSALAAGYFRGRLYVFT